MKITTQLLLSFMLQSDILFKVLLTIAFGAILGLETETREIEKSGKIKALKLEKSRIGGVRTYTVLSLFGGVAGLLFNQQQYILSYIFFGAIILLVLSAYILNVQIKHAFGMTTEIAIIITFTLGFFTTSSLIPLSLVLVVLVLLTFFLSQKRGIGRFIAKIQHKEVIDVIRFALVALVILPLLPNRDFFLSEILNFIGFRGLDIDALNKIVVINPFQIWFIVVLVSGIDLFSYLISKMIGKGRGLIISSIFSGAISSTSATIAYASKSKHEHNIDHINSRILAGSAIISNAASFVLLFSVIFITSRGLFDKLWPVLAFMTAGGFILGLAFVLFNKKHSKESPNIQVQYEPFSIGPALKFVSFIIIIKLVIQVASVININNNILLALTALSGFMGMDAPTIAFSGLVQSNIISVQAGVFAFLLTNSINFLAKTVYSYLLGNKTFFKYVLIGLIITGMIGLAGLLI